MFINFTSGTTAPITNRGMRGDFHSNFNYLNKFLQHTTVLIDDDCNGKSGTGVRVTRGSLSIRLTHPNYNTLRSFPRRKRREGYSNFLSLSFSSRADKQHSPKQSRLLKKWTLRKWISKKRRRNLEMRGRVKPPKKQIFTVFSLHPPHTSKCN